MNFISIFNSMFSRLSFQLVINKLLIRYFIFFLLNLQNLEHILVFTNHILRVKEPHVAVATILDSGAVSTDHLPCHKVGNNSRDEFLKTLTNRCFFSLSNSHLTPFSYPFIKEQKVYFKY